MYVSSFLELAVVSTIYYTYDHCFWFRSPFLTLVSPVMFLILTLMFFICSYIFPQYKCPFLPPNTDRQELYMLKCRLIYGLQRLFDFAIVTSRHKGSLLSCFQLEPNFHAFVSFPTFLNDVKLRPSRSSCVRHKSERMLSNSHLRFCLSFT